MTDTNSKKTYYEYILGLYLKILKKLFVFQGAKDRDGPTVMVGPSGPHFLGPCATITLPRKSDEILQGSYGRPDRCHK